MIIRDFLEVILKIKHCPAEGPFFGPYGVSSIGELGIVTPPSFSLTLIPQPNKGRKFKLHGQIMPGEPEIQEPLGSRGSYDLVTVFEYIGRLEKEIAQLRQAADSPIIVKG